MPKVTIYLPDSLAAQVKELELSVSPICQKALHKEVNKRMAAQQATKDIERVAKRLRETINEEDEEIRKEGYEMGVVWARETASMSELESVVNQTFAEAWVDGPGGYIAHVVGEDLATAWNREPDVPIPGLWSTAWAEGFVSGAEIVLNEVRPLL